MQALIGAGMGATKRVSFDRGCQLSAWMLLEPSSPSHPCSNSSSSSSSSSSRRPAATSQAYLTLRCLCRDECPERGLLLTTLSLLERLHRLVLTYLHHKGGEGYMWLVDVCTFPHVA